MNGQDIDFGATDAAGNGCDFYYSSPEYCGLLDDDDFTASKMCYPCTRDILSIPVVRGRALIDETN